MSHYNQLRAAFGEEWRIAIKPPALQRADLYDDQVRYWVCEDHDGREIIHWECRRFPGCDTLVITTKVELRDDLRGRGLGRFFRELRHRAYKRAGFVGELATVRSDNERQNALMGSMGGVPMGEFRSDFGGTFKLWLTNLLAQQPQTRTGLMGDQAVVRPLRVGVQARTHDQDLSQYILEAPANPTTLGDVWVGVTRPDLDAIAQLPTVQPLPGDGVGLFRTESDASLRARIQATLDPAPGASAGVSGTGYTVGRHPKRQIHRSGL